MPNEPEALVNLTLIDDSGKHLESTPDETTAGLVRLHKWHVDRVALPPGLFIEEAAYLIKVNYELEIESGIPTMSWFEFGLHFDTDISVTVVDAAPQGTPRPVPTTPYALNRHLQLITASPNDDVLFQIPATDERIDLYGIGSCSVRWRHSTQNHAGVHPGSRTAWLLLLAPANRTHQRCQLAVRYALHVDEDTTYLPTQTAASFTIALSQSAAAVDPSPTAPVHMTKPHSPLSAFICYAHESKKFKEDVRKLAELLQDTGIDVHLDQFDVGPRKHWGEWSQGHMQGCDFTLAIASPAFRAVGEGTLKDRHLGLQSEMTKLANLYHKYPQWREYVLPVILPGQTPQGIPLFLGPANEDYYEVHDYTQTGATYLIKAIQRTGHRTWSFEEAEEYAHRLSI